MVDKEIIDDLQALNELEGFTIQINSHVACLNGERIRFFKKLHKIMLLTLIIMFLSFVMTFIVNGSFSTICLIVSISFSQLIIYFVRVVKKNFNREFYKEIDNLIKLSSKINKKKIELVLKN